MNIRRFLWYWGPPVILMVVIFLLSSRQRISVSTVYSINFLVFKSLHVLEYALLYFLLFRAYYNSMSRKNMKKIFGIALATTILYALSDELHQTGVPTRNGALRDIFIDSLGILLCFQYTKVYLSNLKHLL